MGEGLGHRVTKVTHVIRGRCKASNPESRDSGSGAHAPSRNDVIPYPPLIGGIVTCSRRQARRSISSQARNWRSLFMQIRTSLSRGLSQVTAIAELLKPGLALM